VSHDSQFRRGWDLVMLLWLVYVGVGLPFMMAFVHEEDPELLPTTLKGASRVRPRSLSSVR